MSISKIKREEIKQMFGGRCAYCGEVLTQKWHVDHIEPVLRVSRFLKKNGAHHLVKTGQMGRAENDNISNMFPACVPCNLYKSTLSIEQFREALGKQIQQLNDYSRQFRFAVKYQQVVVDEKPIVFFFEQWLEGE